MLQIQQIRKEYRTGRLVQKALDGVSLNLRDNEFVAILGPSGSGKTTLLNIIGGLDRYDSGDLIINGVSTRQYRDRDWDSYRNHTIGFVFQSYNLIPHQTVLANVELALTISGIGKAERRARAVRALEEVGLGDQLHKKPNQMSGGQMQRVAIARALVNDPDILLADEPTGALDSDTSVQVMELLKTVARDRLVVMVTHNPELAEAYATRIVRLRDGKIRSDSDPLEIGPGSQPEPVHRNLGKASMSFLTALSLSFNNLKTKKARTILTSFAGSIGIIGIALILSLSHGVNRYIQTVEEETLSEYPLQIQSSGLDLSSMLSAGAAGGTAGEDSGDVHVVEMISGMFSTMDFNDLESLKAYLDGGESGIESYVNAVEYSYGAAPQLYREDGDGVRQVHPDRSLQALGLGSSAGGSSVISSMMSTDVFYEMPEEESIYRDQYDVMAGRWPEEYNECVLVLTSGGGISDFLLYTLGLRDAAELDEMIRQFIDEEDVQIPENTGGYSYDEILGITFRLVNSADYYEYDEAYGVWRDKTDDDDYMARLVADGEPVTIVGIVQPAEDANGLLLSAGIAYPPSLTRHVAEEAEESEIVQKQLENRRVNVLTGEPFGEEEGGAFDTSSLFTVDEEKLQGAFTFDTSALTGAAGSLDGGSLSGLEGLDLSSMIDLSGIGMTLPGMPAFSLGDVMDGVTVDPSGAAAQEMLDGLMAGYDAYVREHPEADYSSLGDDLLAYLKTEEGRQVLSGNLLAILREEGALSVSREELQELLSRLLAGWREYAQSSGVTDPAQIEASLQDYLETGAAAEVLEQWCGKIVEAEPDLAITEKQLETLAGEIAAGYQSYAQANGLPDPARMGEHFRAYLNTDGARALIAAGAAGMVDFSGLEAQLSGAVQGYVAQTIGTVTAGMAQAVEEQVAAALEQIAAQLSAGVQESMAAAMGQMGENLEDAFQIDPDAFAEAFSVNMDGEELTELMLSLNSDGSATCESNLQSLGYVDFDTPSGIDLYPKDFESKEQVMRILDDYNRRMEDEGKEDQVITYTDMVGALMSSVTDIIDIISYVLSAFVAISLVVSSIMIGVITYISVLERKKEIGILRALGASRENISQVFNAETIIIGFCAGMLGIGLSLLLLISGNALIHFLAGTNEVSAALPVLPAVVLVLLSVGLTLLGGIIPSRKAAKSDPVAALRTE